jgi:hypothetical protein
MDDPSRFGNTSPSSDVTPVSDHARNGYDNVSDDERSPSEDTTAPSGTAVGEPQPEGVRGASSGAEGGNGVPELVPVAAVVAAEVRRLYRLPKMSLTEVALRLRISLPQAYEALARHLVDRDEPLTAATVRAYLDRGWSLELIAAQRHTTVGQLMRLLGEDPEPAEPTGPGAAGSV